MQLRGQRLRARAVGGDVQRDRVFGVEQTDLRVEKPDLAALALDRGLDRIAGEQPIDNPDVFLHLGELHRPEAHCPARRKAGADAEIDAARREAV